MLDLNCKRTKQSSKTPLQLPSSSAAREEPQKNPPQVEGFVVGVGQSVLPAFIA